MLQRINLPFLLKLALVLVSIICIGYLADVGKIILAPLFFALLISLLFLPFANFLERKLKFNRSLSTMVSVLIMISFLGGLIYFFGAQFSDLSDDWPKLQKQVIQSFGQLQTYVSHNFNINFNKQLKYLNEAGDKLISSSTIILGTTLAVFSSSMAFFVFSVIFFIFILNYRRVLYGFITNVFQDEHRSKVEDITKEVQKIIKKYITGLFIEIFIVAAMTSLVLTVLDVKYALLLGVLTGILNVIPYVGIFIAAIFASFISFAMGGSSKFLFVIMGYIGVHLIDSNIILPFVVGSKVKINALFSFIIILIGESLWGISGMFLGIPFLAILKIILERIDTLKPWGELLGDEEVVTTRPKRRLKISKKITLEEKD
ncbi:AI-2E family transporter [Halpernia frigidisoli]|uniref:Predicted PurR-regulated permease PerM n=1 Tax=Halpernia frigidisoli TaxID=1125876 RepID=A0A1I3I1L3_9FLAO|nr:AI-2E family transporter [Halpernia frigidisoli]SFI41844.1 Predicted PurR-regulated permease PerM [Halpernia frigidisoli]